MNKTLSTLMIAGLLLATTPAATASDPWRRITTEDGLPSDEIHLVDPEPDGSVWVGTLKGLVKIDGDQISEPIVGHEVYDVVRVGEQVLVGTNRGLVRLEGDEQTQEMGKFLVTPIIEIGEGRVWALRREGGFDAANSFVVEQVDGQWQQIEALEGRSAVGITRSEDGRVWVTLEGDGVAVFDPERGLNAFEHLLKGLNVTSTFVDSKGQAWFGLWGAGVTMYDGQKLHEHLRDQEMYTYAIREGKGESIWVASDQSGLFCFDGKSWTNLLREEGGVNLLEATADGRVWISTRAVGGLRYWDGEQWVTSIEGPLPISCLSEGPDGTLWAGGVLDGLRVLPAED